MELFIRNKHHNNISLLPFPFFSSSTHPHTFHFSCVGWWVGGNINRDLIIASQERERGTTSQFWCWPWVSETICSLSMYVLEYGNVGVCVCVFTVTLNLVWKFICTKLKFANALEIKIGAKFYQKWKKVYCKCV